MDHASSPMHGEPIDDTHRLRLAAELAGEFVVEREVRRDPWSVVYVAHAVGETHPVAVRVLHDTVGAGQRTYIEHTGHVLARLHHPTLDSQVPDTR